MASTLSDRFVGDLGRCVQQLRQQTEDQRAQQTWPGPSPQRPLPAFTLGFELYDDITPGATDVRAWPLNADGTRDDSDDPPMLFLNDQILGDCRAYGSNHFGGTGAKGYYCPVRGVNQIVSMQRLSKLLLCSSTGGVSSGMTSFDVEHVLPLDDGQSPVGADTDTLSVHNGLNVQLAGATDYLMIAHSGVFGPYYDFHEWRLVSVPLTWQEVITALQFASPNWQYQSLMAGAPYFPAGSSGWQNFATGTTSGSDEQRDDTSVSVSISGGSTYGGTATFDVAVTSSASGTPTGTVVILCNGVGLVSISISGGTGTGTAQMPAGNNTITGVYGGDASFNGSSDSYGTYAVAKCDTAITLTASPTSSTYNDLVTFTAVLTTSGSVSTPLPATGVMLLMDGSSAIAQLYTTGGAGSYTFTSRSLAGGSHTLTVHYTGDSNYNSSDSSDVSFSVSQITLTLTVTAAARLYGAANPFFSYDLTGFVAGQNPSVLGSGSISLSTTADTTSDVGSYAISVSNTYSPVNYTFNVVGANLAVNAAPLVAKANDATGDYGATPDSFSGTLIGVVAGDDLTLQVTTAADDTSPVGGYTLTPTIDDPDSRLGNYSVTYKNGILRIGRVFLHADADDASADVGAVPGSFTGTLTGVVAGDDLTIDVTTEADDSSPAGTYKLTPTIDDPDSRLTNYNVTYDPGTLTLS